MHICTIILKNYVAFARVLARSFREHHPEGTCTVLLVDGPDERIEPAGEPFDLILPSEIGLDEFERMTEDYDVTELATAVKPWLLRTLLDRHGSISYFDPDIHVYDRMDELQGLIESNGIVLMPHFTGPLPLDGKRPSENDILVAGSYNLGYLGLGDTEQAREMLDWWSERLLRLCLIDPARGLFVDQRWIDLVPGRFDRTAIYRDPGHDVAYWNLPHRALTRSGDGSVLVEGAPLRFFHFSGFDPLTPHLLSKHQNRISLADDPVLTELCREYGRAVLDDGFEDSRAWRSGFELFDDPRKQTRVMRRLRAEARDEGRLTASVATDDGREQFFAWLREPVAEGAQAGLNRFLLGLWKSRPDLQAEFPDLSTAAGVRYVEWAWSRGLDDSDVVEELLPRAGSLPDGTPIVGLLYTLWVEARRDALTMSVNTREGAEQFLAWLNGPATPGGDQGVTRYLLAVWKTRADLRRSMTQLDGPDGSRLVEWARAFATSELGAPPSLIPDAAHTDDGPAPPTEPPSAEPPPAGPVAPWGVNVTGYLNAELGVGEVARKMIAALDARSIPVVARGQLAAGSRQGHAFVTSGVEDAPFPVNLVCINADALPAFAEQAGPAFFAGRHTVGVWFWEISEFPERFAGAFEHVDELWAATEHIADALRPVSTKPVRHVRVPVELPGGVVPARAQLGLPDGFVYLYLFDYHSVVRRKNPAGLVEAFDRAFPDGGASLVIKAINGEHHPQRREQLRVLAAERPDVHLIDDYLSPAGKNALIASCDCYVSLHRSEGLGLTMAEAMYLGKPVVATGYSGNLDFMTPQNSWLVDYELVPIGDDAEPYPATAKWAEPDLDHAAACLREVFDDPALAAKRAARGAQDIRATHSPAVTGARMEAILKEVTPVFRKPTAPPFPALGRGRAAVGELAQSVRELSEAVTGLREELAEAERARIAGDAEAAAQVRKLGARVDEVNAALVALQPPDAQA